MVTAMYCSDICRCHRYKGTCSPKTAIIGSKDNKTKLLNEATAAVK